MGPERRVKVVTGPSIRYFDDCEIDVSRNGTLILRRRQGFDLDVIVAIAAGLWHYAEYA